MAKKRDDDFLPDPFDQQQPEETPPADEDVPELVELGDEDVIDLADLGDEPILAEAAEGDDLGDVGEPSAEPPAGHHPGSAVDIEMPPGTSGGTASSGSGADLGGSLE